MPVITSFAERASLPSESGLYAVLVDGIAYYFGKSSNLKNRWKSHAIIPFCKQATSDGKAVEIACWLLPQGQLSYIEYRILSTHYFPWSNDSLTLTIGACGAFVSDARDRAGKYDAHRATCADCLLLQRVGNKASGLYGSIITLLMYLEGTELYRPTGTEEFRTRNSLRQFQEIYGEQGKATIKILNELSAKQAELESAARQRRSDSLNTYTQEKGLRISDLEKLLKEVVRERDKKRVSHLTQLL